MSSSTPINLRDSERFREFYHSLFLEFYPYKLKSLERIGLIKRVVSRTRPPSTRNQLTDEGFIIVKMGEPVFLYLGLTKHFYHNIRSTHPTEA